MTSFAVVDDLATDAVDRIAHRAQESSRVVGVLDEAGAVWRLAVEDVVEARRRPLEALFEMLLERFFGHQRADLALLNVKLARAVLVVERTRHLRLV